MIRITAAKFQKSYGHYSHLARDGEVVMVTAHGSDRAAMISADLLRALALASGREDLLGDTEGSAPVRKSQKTSGVTPAGGAPLTYSGVIRPEPAPRRSIAFGEIAIGSISMDEDPPELSS